MVSQKLSQSTRFSDSTRLMFRRMSFFLGLIGWILALLLKIWADFSFFLLLFFIGSLVVIFLGHKGRKEGQKQDWMADLGLFFGYLLLTLVALQGFFFLIWFFFAWN